MAVPKRKTSKSRRNKRRSHHRIVGANIVEDKTRPTTNKETIISTISIQELILFPFAKIFKP